MHLSTRQTTIRVIAVATTLSSISNYGARGFTTATIGAMSQKQASSRLLLAATTGTTRPIHQYQRLLQQRNRLVGPQTASNCPSSSSSTAMPMIFGRFFSSLGGGGAFESAIDYDSMPYPVPELAQLALDQKVPATIESSTTTTTTTTTTTNTYHLATFAGGCFWGLELAYQRVPGVVHTASGYTRGREKRPNYDAVCAGATGHTEAVIVLYDPAECSYEQLLDVFFDRVDPLTVNGQGPDRGKQYRTGVYYHSVEQEATARARFAQEQQKYAKQPIATECNPATPFWPAEAYHQQYLSKGGQFNQPQSADKGCEDEIRCYG
ncbi:unnamed protein product [Cylindrotheca closterium]|uniref:peptide-methionine (S)-S-oxide reductase n=1 Tax=Cylindrotheca closterium TaxID=2856 RepID=A0AAD2CEV9_9STRA|nr:unnamed protein product [Cylindrotheca closterium]